MSDRSTSKFRHIVKNLDYFLDVLFSIWQTFVPTLAFYATEQNDIVVNCQRLNGNIAIWSHCSALTSEKRYSIMMIHQF